MTIKTIYSSNFSKKTRKFKDIKIIVIHYTGMQSKIVSIKRLVNPRFKVSCHYLIDRKGLIFRMVEDNKVAWHAGKSKWKNFVNLNKCSIGIELINKGHKFGYEKFTSIQLKRLMQLCLKLKKKYKIKNSNIVGHSDVAPQRKKDPGEKFPWKKLKNNNLGIWYKVQNSKKIEFKNKDFQKQFFRNLYKIGYRYFEINRRSKKDVFPIKAFQRRFYPQNVSGKIDKKTFKISHFLASRLNLS